MSNAGYASWPIYDTFLIMLFSDQPVYDPDSLRPNPNPQKPVLDSYRVRGLGRILTPLLNNQGDHVYRDEHMHGGCVLRKPKNVSFHLLVAEVQLP